MFVSLHVRLKLNFVALLKKELSAWYQIESVLSHPEDLSLSLSLSLSFSPSLPLFLTHSFFSLVNRFHSDIFQPNFIAVATSGQLFFSFQPVLDGQRIVGLPHLFHQLEAGCFFCGKKPLLGTNCQKEVCYGLALILTIDCDVCRKLNKVTTGTQHWPENNPEHKGMQAFDVNTKASLGVHMYDLWPCIIFFLP